MILYLNEKICTCSNTNIAYDDALLHWCEEHDFNNGILRFWEADSHAVMLGASNKYQDEINEKNCQKDKIPIYRRCSGGGSVLQGPGCLNYSIILPTSYHESLQNLSSTNTYIMNRVSDALTHSFALKNQSSSIHIKGHTDLVTKNKKFSGNAQRRLKKHLLFHGTLLLNFNLEKISLYLKHPPKEPNYRQNRDHKDFIMNIALEKSDIVKGFLSYFDIKKNVDKDLIKNTVAKTNTLLKEKYNEKTWVFKL